MKTVLTELRAAMSACQPTGTRDFDSRLQEARMLKYIAGGAFLAFVASGPLQHVGALPQTVVGDLSKQAIKLVLGLGASDAYAQCGPGGKVKGNNGWGNGEHFPPGNSLSNQPKFEDPNTGPTPSKSPRSGGGDR